MKRISNVLLARAPDRALLHLSFQLLLAGALVSAAGAATKTWDGSSNGDWAAGANWNGNTVPVAGDSLVFPLGVATIFMSNNLPAGLLISNITFRGTNYSVSGNAIQLAGGITCELMFGAFLEFGVWSLEVFRCEHLFLAPLLGAPVNCGNVAC